MKAWLISVVAIVVLTVLLEVLLLDGNTKKYIHGVVRIVLIITMIFPILGLFAKNITYDDVFLPQTAAENITDQSFLKKIQISRYNSTELNIQKELQKQGIMGAVVSIDIYYADNYLVQISNVYVDINNAVITKDDMNIFINDTIIKVIQSYLVVDKEKIIIYG